MKIKKKMTKINFKIKDKVKLPFDETGTIVKIVTEEVDWFPYKIRIRKANPLFFNKTNQVEEFKESQLELEL